MKPLVEVKNLSVSFDTNKVLDNVSFDIYSGDVLAIIGPNGAGKTVLLRTILGLNPNFNGTITWHRRPEVSYVPQKVNFERHFPLTVRELMLLERGHRSSFWKPSPRHLNELEARLSEVGAEHLLNTQLGNLSQGELQRVLVAMSLLEKPEIIFFDEPAAGIDIGTEETIYQVINDLHQKQGVTLVIVSHELNVVYRFAKRVLCLNQRLVCEGVPSEILDNETLQSLFGRHTSIYKHEHKYN